MLRCKNDIKNVKFHVLAEDKEKFVRECREVKVGIPIYNDLLPGYILEGERVYRVAKRWIKECYLGYEEADDFVFFTKALEADLLEDICDELSSENSITSLITSFIRCNPRGKMDHDTYCEKVKDAVVHCFEQHTLGNYLYDVSDRIEDEIRSESSTYMKIIKELSQ